jgi:hypothetical protein
MLPGEGGGGAGGSGLPEGDGEDPMDHPAGVQDDAGGVAHRPVFSDQNNREQIHKKHNQTGNP